MEAKLLTHAEFAQHSKYTTGKWLWSIDGHTDEYEFIPDGENDEYWHVLCPKHDRSASALLDSDQITLRCHEERITLKVLTVHRIHRRSTAIIHVSTENS